MIVIIAGSRTFNKKEHFDLLVEKCDAILSSQDEVHIISGDASGIDFFADRYAWKRGYKYTRYPAKWNDVEGKPESEIGERKDGSMYWKSAGPVRNKEMVEVADALIAFWDGKSPGTKDVINQAKSAGLKVREVIHSS